MARCNKKMNCLRAMAFLALAVVNAQVWAAVFTVTSVADDDLAHDANPGDGICEDANARIACTLRAAIEEANALPSFDGIHFGISGVIRVDGGVGRLPAITDGLNIDGRTAPGYPGISLNLEDAFPVIEIDGTELTGQSSIGLDFRSGTTNSAVRGLSLIGFDSGSFGEAIRIRGTNTVSVDSCYIGLNRLGQIVGNRIGLFIEVSSDNRIGRFVADIGGVLEPRGYGNVISGNRVTGLRLHGATSGTVIGGNRIGTTADGLAAAPNGRGILSAGSSVRIGVFSSSTSLGNIIAGNLGDGIYVGSSLGVDNAIAANRIGVNLDGAALANGGRGIHIVGNRNLVGTSASEPLGGNLIANNSPGVEIDGDYNVVHGNQVGSMVDSQGNSGAGILIAGGVENIIENNNIVNSEGPGIDVLGTGTFIDRNVIGLSTTHGILLRGSDAIITRNDIGLAADGTPLGNGAMGIIIYESDGLNHMSRNTIAFNTFSGIALSGSGDTDNSIIRNAIYSNGSMGIDLSPGGPTPNDPGDADTGPNNLQNHPEITSLAIDAAVSPAELTIEWQIDSTPGNSLYPIVAEFYLADDGVSGEGKTFLGQQSTEQPGTPNTFISFLLPPGTIGGYLVATATDDSGFGSTSEFSAPIAFGVTDGIFFNGFELGKR